MIRPIAIDLCCGAGGMTLGFEQAGFDIVCAVDIDPIHSATHKFNFPNCKVINGDIGKIKGEDIQNIIGKETQIDLIIGGSPCQGFSRIGKQDINDVRNNLLFEFARIVNELKPKYFVLENVPGLLDKKYSNLFQKLLKTFDSYGYYTGEITHKLNAKDFSVPQNRERIFIVGAIKGLAYPNLYFNPNTYIKTTVRDALKDIPDVENPLYSIKISADEFLVESNNWYVKNDYAEFLNGTEQHKLDFSHPRMGHGCKITLSDLNQTLLTSSATTNHSDVTRKRFNETTWGSIEPISHFYKLHPDCVANTLRAGTNTQRGSHTAPRPIHYLYQRCITVREGARLHSYPDWFRFHVSKFHGFRQLGNSVCPWVARDIGSRILDAMGFVPVRPTQKIKLGNEGLLWLNPKEAEKQLRF